MGIHAIGEITVNCYGTDLEGMQVLESVLARANERPSCRAFLLHHVYFQRGRMDMAMSTPTEFGIVQMPS